MAEEPVRKLLINQSMTKPILIMGCERNLFAAASLFCGYTGFNLGLARGKILVLLAAVLSWIGLSFGLRLMGKADPFMNAVFTRATKYSDKPFRIQYKIPARGSLASRPNQAVRKRWD
ncbi:MAG: VirB3 family type IV secretion system protein [Synergistaceae bacterium]|jgi:type IV secretory pathway TrbD component|nr:VirB3 family type IV secretion system protein [Synergistaceae bacterium]